MKMTIINIVPILIKYGMMQTYTSSAVKSSPVEDAAAETMKLTSKSDVKYKDRNCNRIDCYYFNEKFQQNCRCGESAEDADFCMSNKFVHWEKR